MCEIGSEIIFFQKDAFLPKIFFWICTMNFENLADVFRQFVDSLSAQCSKTILKNFKKFSGAKCSFARVECSFDKHTGWKFAKKPKKFGSTSEAEY